MKSIVINQPGQVVFREDPMPVAKEGEAPVKAALRRHLRKRFRLLPRNLRVF